MKGLKQIRSLRKKVKDQYKWMEKCGGNLAGYIANYGDPGIAPLDKNGQPKLVKLSAEQAATVPELKAVPNRPGYYYFLHTGDGGTLIYQADFGRLELLKAELKTLEAKYEQAAQLPED